MIPAYPQYVLSFKYFPMSRWRIERSKSRDVKLLALVCLCSQTRKAFISCFLAAFAGTQYILYLLYIKSTVATHLGWRSNTSACCNEMTWVNCIVWCDTDLFLCFLFLLWRSCFRLFNFDFENSKWHTLWYRYMPLFRSRFSLHAAHALYIFLCYGIACRKLFPESRRT